MQTDILSSRELSGLGPSGGMRAKFLREVAEARLPLGPGPCQKVTDQMLDALPPAACRYLRFMRVIGRPRTWSFCARWSGAFRMRPDQPWMPCEAWQYNSSLEIARIFHMRLRFAGVLPVLARDTYVHGHGHMLGRLFDRFSIVDDASEQISVGELVTWLSDAIFFAPSMLLGLEATWTPVDQDTFDVTLTDQDRTVSARVSIDENGALTNFTTIDRYASDPADPQRLVRTRWSTPIDGWAIANGRPVPARGKAIWHFPSGDFTYAIFVPDPNDIDFDVAPRALR